MTRERDEAKNAVVKAVIIWHSGSKDREPYAYASEHALANAARILEELPAPACATCDDRGRVWRGEGGETAACPSCCVWGVFEIVIATGHNYGCINSDDIPWPRWRADAFASAYNAPPGKHLRAEVRRYVPEPEKKEDERG